MALEGLDSCFLTAMEFVVSKTVYVLSNLLCSNQCFPEASGRQLHCKRLFAVTGTNFTRRDNTRLFEPSSNYKVDSLSATTSTTEITGR